MRISAGTRLGLFEILSAIGAGGMGEVYEARDTKLGRNVAIKVLPAAFANDPERLARFQREAKMLAALNHPNIAAIYRLEQSDGVHFLVMELVPGETLAERVKAGPVPVDEALKIAAQIAEALEAAHDKGIIHRDLKPANAKITPEAKVKVLDFGLAKAFEGDADTIDPGNSPTLSQAATMQGVILGTAAYMSPEQARGKSVDRRTDIWAFGCVLYELLTGRQAFAGEDTTEILAAVVKSEPDWTRLPPSTPSAISLLLHRCLRKNRRQRIADAADVRIEIEDALSGAAPVEPVAAPRQRPLVWIAVSAVLLFALAAVSFSHFREAPPQQRTVRFQIPMPEKATLVIFQLSPDGKMVAFSASASGRRQMWVRPIDSLTARPLPETENATYPIWSPDSAFIAFFASGKLKKVALAGGPSQTICDAPDGRGGSWNSNGVIIFSPGPGSPISSVPAGGGTPKALTKVDSPNELHRYPVFLPDGKHFLYLVNSGKPGTNGINVGSLDGVPPVHVLNDESSAAYAPSDAAAGNGLLLFRREDTLIGAPFDTRELRITGEVFPVAEAVGISANASHAAFSVSENGALAYSAGTITTQGAELVWMDRTGKRLSAIGQPERKAFAALSPDGKRISYSLRNEAGDTADIWLMDVARGVPSRFTFRPGVSMDAIWSPDGTSLIFGADFKSIYRKPVNGTGNEEPLLNGGINDRPLDWSPDGRFIVYQTFRSETGYDLFLLPVQGDPKPIPYLETPFNEGNAQFSPDGRWMAYASNESGHAQVYVQAIPAGGAKWQISSAGGDQPRWRRDGRELFYISADQKLMAVPVKGGAIFEAGALQPLFEIDPFFSPITGAFIYQPTADGQRFLVLSPVGGVTAPPINVVLNWQAGLRK